MAERRLMYLIGQPGSGKTTLLRATLADVPCEQLDKPFALLRYPGGYEVGGIRAGFGGSDVLSLNVQPAVLRWLRALPPCAVLVEGDRLANDKFFVEALLAGYDLSVVWLRCPDPVAQARRDARGSHQDATWLAGRKSKVERLGEAWASSNWILDATLPINTLARTLRAHPAIQQVSR